MKTQITNLAWFFSILLALAWASGESFSQGRSVAPQSERGDGKGGRGGGWGDEKRELTLPIALAIATAARNQAENCAVTDLAGHIAAFLSAAGDHYVSEGQETKHEAIPLEAGALRCLEQALSLLQTQGK